MSSDNDHEEKDVESGPESRNESQANPPQRSIRKVDDLQWDGSNDPANPLNWSRAKKIYHTFIPSVIALVSTLGSSIITPAVDNIQKDLGVSAEVSLLPYVLYVLGLASGPLLSGPLSEGFGRRGIYLISVPLFALFILGAGFSTNIASLTICRFFAGVFGSPGLSMGAATLSDIWQPHERAIPWAIFITTPFLGPSIGPPIGGYVTLAKDWRWTQWTLLFFTVVGFLPVFGTKETYKQAILKRRAKMDGVQLEHHQQSMLQRTHTFATKLLTRPIHMAFVEPVVGLFAIYVSINFGMTYGFFAAFPYVFEKSYGFGIGQTGLTFLGQGVGCLIACIIMIVIARLVFRRQVARSREAGYDGKVDPEKRLYLAMIGSLCLPVSLFWFAWSAQYQVHWICPVLAEVMFACGNLLVFTSSLLYVIDFYGPAYGASANAANALFRYTLAAAFPLFIVQMYRGLGIGWATSLLGFVSVLLLPIPWLFFRYGPRLRERSQYIK